MTRRSFASVQYLVAVGLLTVAVAGVAWWARDATLGFAAAILGLYVLHLVSLRFIVQAQREQRAMLDEQFEILQQILGQGPLDALARRPPGPSRKPPPAPVAGTVFTPAPGGGVTQRDPDAPVPVPRHFALGTVALVRRMLEPEDVVRILIEQRQRPDRRFGETAIFLGLLTESQLEELLLAQQEGLFSDEEIQAARMRLEAFRREHAPSAAD